MTEEITVAELNKIVEAVKNNSHSNGYTIYLGNLLEIKPVYTHRKGKTGEDFQELEAVDVYRYADEELMEDDNYDFDSDYITTIYLK